MPAGGGDIAGIGGIVAAQRAFAAVDDPFGGSDDPVERRTQRFVERGIEDRSPRAGSPSPSIAQLIS